ncbi:MAG: membrane protein insertase YidC [Muribaculaceae bacterium]|nr:membrane protein insertase YidC [Muribaculaceae bacterium]
MKNGSVQMLLIMFMVFFGMMLMTKGCQEPQTEGTDNQLQQEQNYSSNIIDSIRPADVRYVADFLREAGTPNENGSKTFNYKNVTLNLESDTVVTGTIAVNDSVAVTYDQIVSNQFPVSLSLNQKSLAVSSLREAIAKARDFQGFARHLVPAEGTDTAEVTLRNEALSLKFNPKGGIISEATLLKYYTYFPEATDPEKVDTAEVHVWRATDNAHYEFTLRTAGQQEISTRDLYFTPKQVSDSVVEMTLDLPSGAKWGYRYTLRSGEHYLVNMEVIQHNVGDIIPPSMNTAQFRWHQLMPRQELGRTFEERNSGIWYKYVGDSPEGIDGTKTDSEKLDHSVRWLAYKNQFFSTVMIPHKPFDGGAVAQAVQDAKINPSFVKDMDAVMIMPYDNVSDVACGFDIFIGPNLYPLLSSMDDHVAGDDDLDLTRLIPLGWNWLRWINTIIIIPIFTFLSKFITNYGIIILILTIIIKILLFPFTYKSYQSQAKMRILAPEIKAINEKYPGQENAMKRQQETMALYSRAGASPMSGCLPMLLQMPILIAMFSFFPSCIELRGESFLWADNLAAPDVIFTLPFSIPFYGSHVSLFCLLMTASNILYTYINMKSQPTSADMPGMKWMMYLMPLMFLFFFNDYASALSYYYFLSLILTVIQTWVFRRCINEKKLRQKMMENAAKPKKKSGFMARLEEAQRRQQAMLREQEKANAKRRR